MNLTAEQKNALLIVLECLTDFYLENKDVYLEQALEILRKNHLYELANNLKVSVSKTKALIRELVEE